MKKTLIALLAVVMFFCVAWDSGVPLPTAEPQPEVQMTKDEFIAESTRKLQEEIERRQPIIPIRTNPVVDTETRTYKIDDKLIIENKTRVTETLLIIKGSRQLYKLQCITYYFDIITHYLEW